MLSPGWIADNAARFDVMHLHFGSESLSPRELTAALDALRAIRRPLVYTVHDLSHPQLHDQAPHRRQLELLIARADGLITLTAGAAAEIEARWGRRPLVLGHPTLLAPGQRPPQVAPTATPVIGLALRDLRPSIDGPGATATLLDAAARLRRAGTPAAVRVTMRDRVRDPAARDAVRRSCAAAAAAGERVELIEEGRSGDRRLARELSELAIDVLPYRHGTHSGWLELCWDLGVPVAAPAIGHLSGQHPEPGFLASFTPADGPSLARALSSLLTRPEAVAGSPARREVQAVRAAVRRQQRGELAAAHLGLYRRLIAAGGVEPG